MLSFKGVNTYACLSTESKLSSEVLEIGGWLTTGFPFLLLTDFTGLLTWSWGEGSAISPRDYSLHVFLPRNGYGRRHEQAHWHTVHINRQRNCWQLLSSNGVRWCFPLTHGSHKPISSEKLLVRPLMRPSWASVCSPRMDRCPKRRCHKTVGFDLLFDTFARPFTPQSK